MAWELGIVCAIALTRISLLIVDNNLSFYLSDFFQTLFLISINIFFFDLPIMKCILNIFHIVSLIGPVGCF